MSTTRTSYWRAFASAIARRATSTGSPTPLPGSGAKTSTSARSPTIWSWVTAFGRCRSQAASIGVWPWFLSQRASLPARVVLPEPCRPASMITVGGFFANRSRRVSPPRMPTSSSLTILTTCCAGFRASETSAPLARSLTCLTNSRTTGSATSASSSAIRISRQVLSMSVSDSRPLPRRSDRTEVRRSDRVSNTTDGLPGRWATASRRCLLALLPGSPAGQPNGASAARPSLTSTGARALSPDSAGAAARAGRRPPGRAPPPP